MQSKKIPILSALVLLTLAIIPHISAAYNSWGWGYYSSPEYILDNDWVRFAIIFVIMFAIIYFAVQKTFKNNSIAATIALGISLLISVAMAQQGLLYSYAGDTLGNIAIMLGVAAAIFALFKVLIENLGMMWGSIGGVITGLIILSIIDLESILPSNVAYGPVGDLLFSIIEFITDNFILVLIIAGLIIFFIWNANKQNERRGTRRSKDWNYKNFPDVIFHR